MSHAQTIHEAGGATLVSDTIELMGKKLLDPFSNDKKLYTSRGQMVQQGHPDTWVVTQAITRGWG